MSVVAGEYVDLLQMYVGGFISASNLADCYLNKFKSEVREMSGHDFQILDGIFVDLDSFTYNIDLINQGGGFYIDECQLRERVVSAISRLQ